MLGPSSSSTCSAASLGGKDVLAFECWGVPFRVDLDGSPRREAVLDRLPPGTRPAPAGSSRAIHAAPVFALRPPGPHYPFHVITADGRESARIADADLALDAFEGEVRFHVCVHSPVMVFVHAGVVAWRGLGVVIPGFSGSGKSTLVAALVRAGATYYSDEYAVIAPDGGVHPFAKPIALATNGSRVKARLDVRSIGGTSGQSPVGLDVVVRAPFEAGAGFDVSPLSEGACVLALLGQTVVARTEPDRALRVLGRAAGNATGWKGVRGEATDAARRLLDLIDRVRSEG